MNEVYLCGKVAAMYEPEAPASQPRHLVCRLRVSHKNARQQVKHENYTVNAWRNMAAWAAAHLQVGMDVFVRGHLSQRQSDSGTVTEVTALYMTPVLPRPSAPPAEQAAGVSGASAPVPSNPND